MTLTSTQDMNKEPKDNPSTKHETPKTARDPIEIDVHGLKAKFFLNRPLQDIIPEKYLAKAEKTRTFITTTLISQFESSDRKNRRRPTNALGLQTQRTERLSCGFESMVGARYSLQRCLLDDEEDSGF